MTREIGSKLSAALAGTTLRGIYLADFALDGETVRVWSGAGVLSWDGVDWIGMGEFGKVSQLEETAGGKETGAVYELSGIPSDLLGDFLEAELQGRTARLWFAALDEDMAQIDGDPALIDSGLMDQVEIGDDGETVSIRVTSENRSRGQIRSVRRVYSDADQQAEYPGDTFFGQTPSLPNAKWVWGRAAAGGEQSG